MTEFKTPPSTEIYRDDLLEDKTALITGGGTGIGEHLSHAFADHGARIAIASRSMDNLEPVRDEINDKGGECIATTVNIREKEEVDEMRNEVLNHYDEIDILVNNAGANFLCPAKDLSANAWRSVLSTVLDGTAYCSFSIGEHMIEEGNGGSIISMGAVNSVEGAPYHAHSGAGKAGVHNLMMSLASEWAQHGIRANTVAPGVILTPAIQEVLGSAGSGYEDRIKEYLAIKRLGEPRDCVPVTLFLASDASAYVTGSYYAVDGGQLIAPTPF